jgi:hypothetical protein
MAENPRQTINHLLASLPAVEHKRLLRHLKPIHFGRKRILYVERLLRQADAALQCTPARVVVQWFQQRLELQARKEKTAVLKCFF